MNKTHLKGLAIFGMLAGAALYIHARQIGKEDSTQARLGLGLTGISAAGLVGTFII